MLDLYVRYISRTKAKSPQSNGICERFNKTCKDEFYSIAFRKKVYRDINDIQLDLDEWVWQYNHERTHSGKCCYGKTPMRMFMDSIPLAKEKLFDYDVSDDSQHKFLHVSDHILAITYRGIETRYDKQNNAKN